MIKTYNTTYLTLVALVPIQLHNSLSVHSTSGSSLVQQKLLQKGMLRFGYLGKNMFRGCKMPMYLK